MRENNVMISSGVAGNSLRCITKSDNLLDDKDSNCRNIFAIIIKNCVVKKYGNGGSAVRTVEEGTLIQVWSCFNEVRFSIVHDETLDTCSDTLICNGSDIKLVPQNLYAALLPISHGDRLEIMRDEKMVEELANLNVGHRVDVVGTLGNIWGRATIIHKGSVPGLKPGVYYGLRILERTELRYDLIRSLQTSPMDLPPVPDCDTIVTIKQIRPPLADHPPPTYQSTAELHLNEAQQGRLAKSVSYHSIRSTEDTTTRRSSSRSLDLTNHNSFGKFDGTASTFKQQFTSRSLDVPNSTKRLSRDRACSSLDSEVPNNRVLSGLDPPDFSDDELGVGSLVELVMHNEPYYGVIRWIGRLPDGPPKIMAGIEMEGELDVCDGARDLFRCPPNKAFFTPLDKCRRDSRFQDIARRRLPPVNSFGQIDCPVVEGTVPPITHLNHLSGKNRGIQGHHNSCYLDATLFAMFAFTSVFDSLLYRPPTKEDILQYTEVQRVLRDEIVNPLRRNLYVRADRVMKLRTLLEQLSSVTGLTSEEKDPEEFLNSLLAQILKAEPLLQLSSGQAAYHYQLFVEKDERLTMPSVQQLLEQSFIASDIKLKQLPPCLIVQMPRFGKAFKMYPRILPSVVLDVTDVIENSPRQCTVCGELAELECRDCFVQGLESGSFCRTCLEKAHRHHSRNKHAARTLEIPSEFRELQDHSPVPRLCMKLFAVVCIETSHYVAFINSDRGWVFFDSMADRKGEQNGYNIPEIVLCPEVPFWLSEEGAQTLGEMPDERQLPELAKRLLCDAYMCMYQSPEVMMYR